MSKALTPKERAALAMHELMKREQQRYADRISEQRALAVMSDEELNRIVTAMPVAQLRHNTNTIETKEKN